MSFDLLSTPNDFRISPPTQKSNKSVKIIQVFISQKNFLEVSKPCKFIWFHISAVPRLFSLSNSFPCEREEMWFHYSFGPKQIVLVFLIFHHRNSLWKSPWERCSAHTHRVIIKHRSHSILSQLLLLLTAVMTQVFQRHTWMSFPVMIYYILGTLD